MQNFGFFGMESFGGGHYEAPTLEACAPEYGGYAVTAMEATAMATDITIHMSTMENIVSRINYEVSKNGLSMESAVDLHYAALEASAAGVGGKVKAAIQKLWGMVKSFFSAIRRTFDGMIMSTKDFATKYKTQLEALKVSGMKFKTYTYTKLDGAVADVYSDITILTGTHGINNYVSDEGKENQNELSKEKLNSFRGKLVGEGSVDADEFSKKAFSYFRDGAESESDKNEIDVNIHTVLNSVKSNEKYVKELDSGQTKMDTFFKKTLDDISKLEVEASKKTSGFEKDGKTNEAKASTGVASRQNYIYSRVSAGNTVAQAFITAWRAAVVEQDKVNKAILTKAFSYKKKED